MTARSRCAFGLLAPLELGEAVLEADITDIDSIRFEGVDVPTDAGIVSIFSHGWRKGLFLNVAPLLPDPEPRDYSLEQVLGSYYASLTFPSTSAVTSTSTQRTPPQRRCGSIR